MVSEVTALPTAPQPLPWKSKLTGLDSVVSENRKKQLIFYFVEYDRVKLETSFTVILPPPMVFSGSSVTRKNRQISIKLAQN